MPKKETYNKTKNIPLPPELVNQLCDHFQTDNASEAIRKGIHEFLTKSSYSKRMDDFALHQIILTVEERTTIKKYSIRITDDMDKALKAYATNDTSFNTVTVMLANYLYFSGAAQAPSTPAKASSLPAPGKFEPDYSMKLLPLAGSKWSPVMQDAIKKIFDSSGKRWQTSIDAFVGALGIFSNFKVADHEVINDIDLRKVNLYRAIRDYMYILLEKMLSKPVDEDTFGQCKSLLNNGEHLSDAEVNLDAAACFLFTTLLSVRNTGHTFSGKALSTYRKNMDAIALLNERMKDTEIYGRYALELIEKYMKSEDSIFIIDPPYIDTNIYKSSIIIDEKYDAEKEEFGYKEHMRLAKLLRNTHQEYGNDFIYFCRITAPHKFDSKTDKDKHDRHMEGRIDDLYWGYGHYYIDVPLLKDNSITAIERIITSFDFSGAQPYGNGRGQN